ncbi:hypothetical protein GALL_489360 [mine drainage metagenome]|uniref:Uncharacterized protein n=1 Tax=mine drainage metagenome TaxID=410659 RepID=A0A1J5PFA5_9ZZZZ
MNDPAASALNQQLALFSQHMVSSRNWPSRLQTSSMLENPGLIALTKPGTAHFRSRERRWSQRLVRTMRQSHHDADALRENRAQQLSQVLANFLNVITWAICIGRSNLLIY